MDAFSASLMADKREIVFAPTVYKFQTFAQMAEEFKLGERDVVLTNEFIYTPFMKELGLKCNFVFQEKFGAGEPSEAMIQTMYDAIPYDSYDRVIAVGGGAIMDLCKLLGCKRPDTVHNLYFKHFPVVHEKDVIAIPTTCGVLSDDCDDVVWQCAAEQADLLLLETDFTEGVEDKDVSARCDIAIEVKRKLPDCRVYLICEDGHPEKLAALEKAAELKLIDGYCIGDLDPQQMRAWLDETAEAMPGGSAR